MILSVLLLSVYTCRTSATAHIWLVSKRAVMYVAGSHKGTADLQLKHGNIEPGNGDERRLSGSKGLDRASCSIRCTGMATNTRTRNKRHCDSQLHYKYYYKSNY